MQAGYVEQKCVDGMASTEQYMLTFRAKNELLSDYKPSHRKCKRMRQHMSNRFLKNHDTIKEKALFFNTSEQQQIDRLASLLSVDNFPNIQKRLEEQGMRKGFACLFYGGPGTGKTETVLQLARKTGRNIMQVDMSQMRDKYVGESEKNVKQIFTRYRQLCRESDLTPILLLNEADALLGVRLSKVEHSVDQMANTMQNILLQEMENLDGILIATTNLTQNLDSAFDRRFLYKVEFLKPTAEESRHIWKAMLPEISEDDALMLAKQYAFSGGHIENIARKQIVNSILFPEEGRDLDKIRQACDSEYLNKNNTRPIGFC
jgi:SpoVK/Ycf46/Vps4 family AAA+-type ATPase